MRHVALVAATLVASTANAQPAKHPRMLLTPQLKAAWQQQAKAEHGPVVGAIALCNDAATGRDHERAQYQGSEWSKVVEACLVAWAATDDKAHAATAIRYTKALLDDLDEIGDGKGGNEAARRDDGYAIRNLGPSTALAYDWLYDQMPADLKARAHERWKAWLDWYREKGYRANTPATNYHAGYLIAATTIGIGGDVSGLPLDDMWKGVAAAFTGPLAGGDWPEGWQYGPLSVAEIALGARIMKEAGHDVPGVGAWLDSLLKRHIYALSPGDGVYAGGDLEDEQPNAKPSVMTLDAVALGDASPDARRWARGELNRLRLADNDHLLYDALAGVGDKPEPPPRASWPTWYLAEGTGTLYARTRWDDQAIWLVTTCHGGIDVDHRHPDAGNFVLSRGKDDVIVDPSPYGSQSTLTSNAPTVASGHLPKDYIPSQGSWGKSTGFDVTTQRKSGVVVARCDYSDQYRFQDRKSDVPDAFRDLVLIPSADGKDAALVVLDRANTGDSDRPLYVRFRTTGKLALDGTTAQAQVGGTKLVISGSAKPTIGTPTLKDCFKEGTIKGQCDAARFPITDVRETVPGPKPVSVHVISATGGAPATVATIDNGVRIGGVRDAVVAWKAGSYKAPKGALFVSLDGGDVTAKADGDGCAVETSGKGTAIVQLGSDCKATEDPEAPAASAAGTRAKRVPRSPRSGCCGAQAAPSSPIAMSLAVLALLFRRRRR